MKTAAKAAGLKTYFTGLPCKHGHIAERSAATGHCRECLRLTWLSPRKVAQSRNNYHKNKEKRSKSNRERYQKNKEKHRKWAAAYYAKNKERLIARIYQRLRTDPQYKLASYIRRRLLCAVRKNLKTGSAVRDLGCSISELKVWIEAQFKPGMTWNNWSHKGWHIDHKRPLISFDLTDREQFLQAFHYTNLQPLWAHENMAKNKYWRPD